MTKKMNFKVFLFIAVTMLCFSFLHSETIAQPPSNYDENDAGTHFNPYLISNLANLRWLSETPSVWGSQTHRFFFKQTENIEAADTENWNQGLGFSAIGKMSAYFFGIYDGGNYHIHNLYSNVHGTDEITGMFGMINRATIENVHLRDANIKGGLYYGTGSLVTFAQNSLIRWCSVSGNVYNENCFGDVGGLVGYTHATDIYHCYSLTYINVGNVRSLGGLVGFLGFNSFLRFGYFNGIIINEIPSSSMDYYNVGGVVGWSTEAELRNIYAASKTPFQHNMSGIVGRADTWTTVYDAHWDICTTGKTNGVYIVFPTSIVDAIGFSTSEMKSTISYSNSQGWDFINTWIIDNSINEGYPSFKENIAEKPINFYEINSGSEQNPFLISNIFNLKWLSEAREFWGNANRQFYFLQTQDINAIVTKYWNGEEGFIPIGIRRVVANEIRFRGVYDGGNYRISNLYIKQRVVPYHDINTALFGSIEFSTIKNINLVNVDITGSWGVAALVGSATASTISNCSTSGVVKHILAPTVSYVFRSPGGASGLIGSGEWDTIVKGSHSNVTIIGENAGNVGGIAASLAQSDISNSYFYGNIDYDAYSIEYVAGGLVGVISFNSNISNSYVASKDPFVDAFGLVGRVINSSISKTYWDIQTTGTSEAYRDNENGAFDDVQGYSTEEMKIQESFTGWDFVDIWNIRHGINAGYPFLRGLPIPVVLLPVVNLSADVDGNVVLLKWEAPEFGMENGQWRMENDNHTY
ncbi:MAG: hypothetical protein FWG98_15860, partial [Candidatus Cloacimonetes bacterium]|nr:hypothetical protein [Candidatus Cloacimonadota bacterium]